MTRANAALTVISTVVFVLCGGDPRLTAASSIVSARNTRNVWKL